MPHHDVTLVEGAFDQEDPAAGFGSHLRGLRQAGPVGFPVSEDALQSGHHGLGLEVPGHRQEGPVRGPEPGMPGQQVLLREGLHGRPAHLSAGGVVAEQQVRELPLRDPARGVVLATQLLVHLLAGDLQLRGVEARVTRHLGQQVQARLQPSRQDIQVQEADLVGEARVESDGLELQLAVQILGRQAPGAAGALDGGGQFHQAVLREGLVQGSAPNHQARPDPGKRGVGNHPDHHSVGKDPPEHLGPYPRYLELHRREDHLVDHLTPLRASRKRRVGVHLHRRQGQAEGDPEKQKRGSHGVVSFWTRVATVRLSRVRYSRATRCTSVAVTAM